MSTNVAAAEMRLGYDQTRGDPDAHERRTQGWADDLAALWFRSVMRQERRERQPRSLSGWLPIASLLWPLFYGPLGYLWLTGWRPASSFLRQLLLTLLGVHSGLLVLGWGGLRLRNLWQRWSRQMRLRSAGTLEQLLALSPTGFEEWTAALFERYGYEVLNTADTGDHGIDLSVTGPTGERGIVQCKRYRGTVGEPVVRDLYGTMLHVGADVGFLVTTGTISVAAYRWAEGKPLELVDGATLAELWE